MRTHDSSMTSILPACCSSSSVNAFFTSESVKLSNTIARSKGVTLKASRLAQLEALTPSARTLVTTRNIVYSMRSFYVCVCVFSKNEEGWKETEDNRGGPLAKIEYTEYQIDSTFLSVRKRHGHKTMWYKVRRLSLSSGATFLVKFKALSRRLDETLASSRLMLTQIA